MSSFNNTGESSWSWDTHGYMRGAVIPILGQGKHFFPFFLSREPPFLHSSLMDSVSTTVRSPLLGRYLVPIIIPSASKWKWFTSKLLRKLSPFPLSFFFHFFSSMVQYLSWERSAWPDCYWETTVGSFQKCHCGDPADHFSCRMLLLWTLIAPSF